MGQDVYEKISRGFIQLPNWWQTWPIICSLIIYPIDPVWCKNVYVVQSVPLFSSAVCRHVASSLVNTSYESFTKFKQTFNLDVYKISVHSEQSIVQKAS